MLSKLQKKTLMGLIEGKILFNEPMKNHTSFCIGGPADALIVPKNENDLKNIINWVKESSIQLVVIGNGTKLLVSDEGILGIVIKISGCFDYVDIVGNKIEVGAGFSLPNLCKIVADRGLQGLEFAAGIPGTVGAGVVMNAGAHGHSISDVVTNVLAMGFEGETKEYSKNELRFGYRESIFQKKPSIILNVGMDLIKGDVEKIRNKMYENLQWRKQNQPLDFPNAGSIFKNPPDLIAGKLIDGAGLKGIRIGDAKISEKRANFILNLGNASASDVLSLIKITQTKVFKKYNVKLEPEIRLININA